MYITFFRLKVWSVITNHYKNPFKSVKNECIYYEKKSYIYHFFIANICNNQEIMMRYHRNYIIENDQSQPAGAQKFATGR